MTARLWDEMERDYLEAMGQTRGLYSVLLTAKMLQGKIKWTERPEECLHKSDVVFSNILTDDSKSNAAPVIVFFIIHPVLPEKAF